MKIAVVGVGGTGSAAVRWLARAGHEVTAFEQFRLGHAWGSSHGASRIIRYTYPDAVYTQMMRDAYPLWRALEDEAQEELLVACGGLYFGQPSNPTITQARDALAANSIPFELLRAAATKERFPALRLGSDEVALYQQDMGFLRPTRCVLAQARLARALGAVIHEETPIRTVISDKSGARVVTEAGAEHQADRVIVTAGPWMGNLLAAMHLPLRVTRQQVVYVRPRPEAEAQFSPESLPVWIDADTLYYGFPQDTPGGAVKLASHLPGEALDPDTPRRDVNTQDMQQAISYAQTRFEGLTSDVASAEACLYTNTPDEDFLMDTPPDMPHLFVVSGCSGHGFKFTVLLGKIAAEVVTGGDPPTFLRRFSLRRFVDGSSPQQVS